MFRSISHKILSGIESKKRLIALIGLIGLGLHFLFISLYTLPVEMTGTKAKAWSQKYALPAFHQQWSLFAPDVEAYNAEIGLRYYSKKNQTWSNWENPVHIQGKESHNLSPKITRAISHELNMAINSGQGVYYIDGQAQFDKLEKSYPYYQAIRYAKKYLEWNEIGEVDSLQLKMHYAITPSPFATHLEDEEKEIELRPISTHVEN